MSITLSQLVKYAKENYKMNFLAGEKNMNNTVGWVHMLEDPETAQFLKGQELIFTTGIGQENTDWFVDFAKGLIDNNASGLVLNIGPYIKEVPEELITYCKEKQFPLFTVPWDTRIVDITNDFCHKIIQSEENELTVSEAFKNAIFFPQKSTYYRSVLEKQAYDLDAEFCVAAISLNIASKEEQLIYEKKIRLHLSKILYKYSNRFTIMRLDMALIVVMQNFPQQVINHSFMSLNEICKTESQEINIHAGVSANDFGILSLSRSYKRAISVLRIAEKQKVLQLHYNDIGIYQLIIEVEDMKVLRRFYDETLGVLESFDDKNNTDYVEILKIYLDKNNSVEKVAKETFVHRNTINYKIKKIKEILNCELNHKDLLNLLLAFHIKEYL